MCGFIFKALNAVLLYFNLVFNKELFCLYYMYGVTCSGMKSELVGVLVR